MNISSESDSEIDKLYEAWGDAFHRQDVQGILDLLTTDYLLLPAGAPSMTRDSLKPRLVAALNAYEVTPSFEREERLVAGDLAFERGWDVQQIRPRAAGETKTQRQRVFLILRRGSDGKWRFARECHNRGQPPNHSMKPHFKIRSECLPRHPAVAYLYLVRRFRPIWRRE